MCGISGFVDFSHRWNFDQMSSIVKRMSDTLIHRGPDDAGFWVNEECGIGLGFRRLAILDLSPFGHQPMHSKNGRFVIVFNGEIYNYLELRKELEQKDYRFNGHSDTEVLLAAFEEWGVEFAVKKSNGMFAIAVYDRLEMRFWLVRDRMGIKPLYYGIFDGTLLFGSELKALKSHPAFLGKIDREALTLYLRYNNVPAPYSIYKNVHKLASGTTISIDLTGSGVPEIPEPVPYWSVITAVQEGLQNPFVGDEQEAVGCLEELLSKSIRDRMISDVPLGAFLSGGVDSSTIVALMQKQTAIPVRTFTIGFKEKNFDESEYARAVSRHLGTEHTEWIITANDVKSVIPELSTIYDEPFSDVSQMPTYLVSRLARQIVTVSLSGDGGDELFYGYDRYTWSERMWGRLRRIPIKLRRGSAVFCNLLSNWMAGASTFNRFAQKAKSLANILPLNSQDDLFFYRLSYWQEPAEIVYGGNEPLTSVRKGIQNKIIPTVESRMMYLDQVGYVQDDILVKVDRASMAVSLESRVPYLDDHRLIEFVWKLPFDFKYRQGKSKWLLRQVLYKYVPAHLIERPKKGFSVPIGEWLQEDLRDWAEDLISENRLTQQGFFNPRPIRKIWDEHISGKFDWSDKLWSILMFQAWYMKNYYEVGMNA